jgi:hypothetical protein
VRESGRSKIAPELRRGSGRRRMRERTDNVRAEAKSGRERCCEQDKFLWSKGAPRSNLSPNRHEIRTKHTRRSYAIRASGSVQTTRGAAERKELEESRFVKKDLLVVVALAMMHHASSCIMINKMMIITATNLHFLLHLQLVLSGRL